MAAVLFLGTLLWLKIDASKEVSQRIARRRLAGDRCLNLTETAYCTFPPASTTRRA